MNLILSDVEETIMIVDTDGTTNGQGTVNVRPNKSLDILLTVRNL